MEIGKAASQQYGRYVSSAKLLASYVHGRDDLYTQRLQYLSLTHSLTYLHTCEADSLLTSG